jgi:hypothetical protein
MPSTDKSLKNALGSYRAKSTNGDWGAMEHLLDARQKRAANLPFRVAGMSMLVGVCAFASWYAIDRGTDSGHSHVAAVPATERVSPVLSLPARPVMDVPAPAAIPTYAGVAAMEPLIPASHETTEPEYRDYYNYMLANRFSTKKAKWIEIGFGDAPYRPYCHVDKSLSKPRWQVHLTAGPGLTLGLSPRPSRRTGVAASVEFAPGWRTVLGFAVSKSRLPGKANVASDAFTPQPAVELVQSTMSEAEFTLNFERDLKRTGRIRPFVFGGTTVMTPLKETYSYRQVDVGPFASQYQTVASIAYDGLDARVGAVESFNSTNESAPNYTLSPYLGILQAGAGVNFLVSESTELSCKVQLQKAFRPIGLEQQSFTALNSEVGFRFNL